MNNHNLLPITMALYPTYNCQLQCQHCFLTSSGKLNNYSLDFKVVKEIIEDAHKNNVFMMIVSGGDPLLYPHIYDVFALLKKYNILPLIGITGVNITMNIAQKLKEFGVDYIQVSLDGYNEKTNSLYRGKNIFKEVVNSIKILQHENIEVNLAICIDKNNMHILDDYLKFALNLNIYKIKVAFWQSTKDIKKEFELSGYDKKTIKSVCQQYNNEQKFNWISVIDKTNNSVYPQLSIGADGNISIGEFGTVIGNVKINSTSYFYGKYVFQKRKNTIKHIIETTKKEFLINRIDLVNQNNINAAALIYQYDDKYYILASNKLSLAVLLFTVLHEIGHIVKNTLKRKVSINQSYSEELEANIWAIYYLKQYINDNFFNYLYNLANDSQDKLFFAIDKYLFSNLLIK